MRVLFKVISVFILLSGIAFSQTDALKLLGRWPDGPCRTVAVDGNYAFINNGSAFEIVDVSNPESFKFVSKLDLADYINTIRVSGSYAYVGGENCLYIIDITDKTLPKITSAFPLLFVYSMVIKDNFVYAACPGRGVSIIDVKNPSDPQIASTSLFLYIPAGVFVIDSLAYVACSDSGLYILNVKDKTAPVILGHYSSNGKFDSRDIFVKDSIAYVTSADRGASFRYGRFHAFNIKNPSNIFEESGITLNGDWWAYGQKIALNGNYAYITSSTDAGDFVTVADVSNPDSIREVLKKHIEYSFDMSIKDKRLFVTAEHKGLLSFDISNPEGLLEMGSFKTSGVTGRVVRKGDCLYVANDQGGLEVLDISKPSDPPEIFSYKGSYEYESCNIAIIKDSLLFTGFSGRGYGLSIFSLESAPGLKKICESEPSDVMKIAAEGNYIYAARPYECLVYNVKDPYHPEKIFTFSNNFARDLDVAVNGSTLYLHEFLKSIMIFNVSDPAKPAAIGYIPVWGIMNFCLDGSYLYASTYNNGIKIFDVSDPEHPREIGKIDDLGGSRIIVQDEFAYVFFTGRGLKVYNVENPALPYLARFYEKSGFISDMYIDKDYIILSEDSEGLSIYKNDVAALFGSREPRIKDFALQQNYPNPFNPSTTISYSIPAASFVELKVFDMLGREVASLVNKEQTAGKYNVQFEASLLPSGIYIYSIQAGKFRDSRKMIIIK
ncbi:MAG TPA: T9SS type A sorting domain-containing protein [Ignavibacteriales bacterium]|nr:T9SS type A sorting domain-containing protein [Ignavibacteriales bacterium]